MSDDATVDVPEPTFTDDDLDDPEDLVSDDLDSVGEPDGSESDRLEQRTTAPGDASEDDYRR